MIDLRPAATTMAALLESLSDADLDRPTPCDCSVAALVTHVGGLTAAFTAAARKDLGPTTGTAPSAQMVADLPADWRTRFPVLLDGLVVAWAQPSAWEGRTQAGGVDLSGAEAGAVVLDELVLHGWDLAVATGRTTAPDPVSLAVVEQFVASSGPEPEARHGLFGPPVTAAPGADRFAAVLAQSGRDPAWSA